MKKIVLYALCLVCFWQCSSDNTPVSVAQQFGDGMVLAKNKPIFVFGEGSGRIKVAVNGVKAVCKAVEGKWIAELPPMEAGGPYTMTVSSKGGSVEFDDVYVGTVLLMSGQSNMQFQLQGSNTPQEEWTADPLLRSFTMPRIEPGEQFTPEDGWVSCSADNVAAWSAIGYMTGKEVRRRTGEAVGIVNCYQGASVIESWIPEERVEKECYALTDDQKHFDHFYEPYKAWNANGVLYHLDIEPFAPYSISRVVWYQGESNATVDESAIYPALFGEMAGAWREAFKDPELPFTIIQIADFIYRDQAGWTAMQEAQEKIPSVVSNTVTVKCADICENDDIHPKSKAALSLRVAETVVE